MATLCPEKERLHAQVQQCLSKVAKVATESIEALCTHDNLSLERLDKELEISLGEKERFMGALRQHIAAHGLWGLSKKKVLDRREEQFLINCFAGGGYRGRHLSNSWRSLSPSRPPTVS